MTSLARTINVISPFYVDPVKIKVIDPFKITDFKRDKYELECFLIFAVLVAGKTAKVISKCLSKLLKETHELSNLTKFMPFKSFENLTQNQIEMLLKKHGIGCYSLKSKAIFDLIRRNFNLKLVSPQDLENVIGIGCKTSRFFVLHSRPVDDIAVIDTHICKHFKDMGFTNAPKSTPNKKQYRKWELLFLELVKNSGMSCAEYDLMIWAKYSRR